VGKIAQNKKQQLTNCQCSCNTEVCCFDISIDCSHNHYISNQHFRPYKKMGKFHDKGKKDYKMNEFFPAKRETGEIQLMWENDQKN
jgi:hypothetical protein